MKSKLESGVRRRINPAPKASREAEPSFRDESGPDACPRQQLIAEAAYFHAERRGFTPGNEMSDWLQAEADIERALGKLN